MRTGLATSSEFAAEIYALMKNFSLPEELGISDYKIIEGDDAIRLAQKWLSIFCNHRTSFKGIRGGKTYLWDEIQSDYQNEKAIIEYSEHFAPSYVLMMDNFGERNTNLFVARQKPTENSSLLDFHVFPKNFAWSMAFTHEDGWIGPKFFRHKDFLSLQKQNKRAVDEIARASN